MIYLVATSICLVFASVLVFLGECYPRDRGHRRGHRRGYPRAYGRGYRGRYARKGQPRRIRSVIFVSLALMAGVWQEVRHGDITNGWATLALVSVVIFGILVWASEAEPRRR